MEGLAIEIRQLCAILSNGTKGIPTESWNEHNMYIVHAYKHIRLTISDGSRYHGNTIST